MPRQETTTLESSTSATSATSTTATGVPTAVKVKPAKPVVIKQAEELARRETPEERTANYIAVWTILLLQNLLEQERVNTLTNLPQIVNLAGNIAAVNSSLKPL